MKVAAKALTIPVLEALCDTYTKNLEQFMQANEIPQDSEVVLISFLSCSVFELSIYFQQCLEKVLRAEHCWIISVIVGISFM